MILEKLVSYLEEAHLNILEAPRVLKEQGINYAAIKNIYSQNVSRAKDDACMAIRQKLRENNITVALLATDLGYVNDLTGIENSAINRVFNLVEYFKAPCVRIYAGSSLEKNINNIDKWMNFITDKCLQFNVTPVIELNSKTSLYKIEEIKKQLDKFRRWKLHYDPAAIIVNHNINPHEKYYKVLRNNTAVIDIHDFKIGSGFKPVGYGDTRLRETLADKEYYGWYIMEPNLGVKYGPALTKQDTFRLAVDALKNMVGSFQT